MIGVRNFRKNARQDLKLNSSIVEERFSYEEKPLCVYVCMCVFMRVCVCARSHCVLVNDNADL
jgi:hypothetical protein